MAKRTNRNHRKNWTRLISGLFVGGVLLFQGTGYITSTLAASNVDVTEGAVIDEPGTYGLCGPEAPATGVEVVNMNGNLTIEGGTEENVTDTYLARLNDDGTILNGVDLSNEGATTISNIYVGWDGEGSLTINGRDADSMSTLNLAANEEELGLRIGDNGSAGVVTVKQYGKIVNKGAIVVGKDGTLVFDASNGPEAYAGSGLLSNSGMILVRNSTEEGNRINFDNYSDSSTGILSVAGDARLSREGESLEINGNVTTGLGLTLSSNTENEVENVSVTGTLKVNDALTLDPGEKQINLTNTGTIYAAKMNLGSKMSFEHKGTLAVGTMNLDDGGQFTATGDNRTVTGMLAEGNQVNLNAGGTMVLNNSLTFENMTVNYNGANISAAETAADSTAFVIGKSAEMKVTDGARVMGANLTIAEGGQFVAENNQSLSLADGKDLTVNGAVLVDFDALGEGSAPVFALGENAHAKFNLGSRIKVKDLSAAKSGERTVTLVTTQTDSDNIYASDLGLDSSAFIVLTDNRETANRDKMYQVTLDVKDFADFGQTANQKAFGRYVDSFRVTGNESDALKGMLNNVMDIKSADEVRAAYDALSATQKANSMMLAMSDPWQYAFDQMNYGTHRAYTQGSPCSNGICRGQVVYEDPAYAGGYDGGYYAGGCGLYSMMSPKSVWASVHHTGFDARSDNNSDGYYIARTGISLGYDMVNCSDVTAGVTFDYSQPFLRGTNHSINASDFRLGLYGKRHFLTGSELAVYVGGGLQNYTSKRDVEVTPIKLHEFYRSAYNGGAFSAAVQLAHNCTLNGWTVVRPFCQIDTQQVWQEGSAEGDAEKSATALRYDSASWNRTFARAGIETEVNNRFMRISGRCFYAGQLNDSIPTMEAGFVGDYTGNVMTIQGVDLGKSYFDVGTGVLGYLDTCYRVALSANYDFASGDKSTAHTGSVNLSYTF